jgi:hypothetical protein
VVRLMLRQLNPRESGSGTHWIEVEVRLRANMDDVQKILDLTGTRTPTPSVVESIASRYTD